MRSNVSRIDHGTKDLAAILAESERVAKYNDLSTKQAMQLRLICEEIDGMLPNIINEFEGKFWIDFEDGVCKVNVSIEIPEFNSGKKGELISLSKDKKNAAAVGIVGKLRCAIEDFLLNDDVAEACLNSYPTFHFATGYSDGVNYSYLWTLDKYRSEIKSKEEKEGEAWDELEKSVIASVADDVIVGIKGKSANIVIVKKFN